MKITLHGGPSDGQTSELPLGTVIKAWLGLRANNPRGTAYGQVKTIVTEEMEPDAATGTRRYRIKPGRNGHYWTPVRHGLRLRWEYGGTQNCCGPHPQANHQ